MWAASADLVPRDVVYRLGIEVKSVGTSDVICRRVNRRLLHEPETGPGTSSREGWRCGRRRLHPASTYRHSRLRLLRHRRGPSGSRRRSRRSSFARSHLLRPRPASTCAPPPPPPHALS
jgi:hypothetical protein